MNREKLDAIWKQMTADKKKLGIMVTLLMVGLLMWGRLLLKEVPRTATAVPQTASANVADDLARTALSDHPSLERDVVVMDLPSQPSRNLFHFDPRPYKRTTINNEGVDIAKLPEDASDDAYRTQAVRQAAARLTLQSVIQDEVPHAIINGQLVKPGDRVEQFEVVRIEGRAVLLRQGQIIVRIGM